MRRPVVAGAPVCLHCSPIFPNEWPRDRVLESGILTPVNAARHVLVFTRILYGTQLEDLHDECLVDCINWLRQLRAAARTLRVVNVERQLFDLWTTQLHSARETIQSELRDRPDGTGRDPEEIRRAVRTPMDAVGWETFGLSVDPGGQRIRVLYTPDQDADREKRKNAFEHELREVLGPDGVEILDIKFLLIDE